jgi:hypothetical protein
MNHELSLAEVGLFNLLQRIHAGTTEIDRFLWHSLVERQLVTDGWPPRLTEAGVQQLQALAHRVAMVDEHGTEPA